MRNTGLEGSLRKMLCRGFSYNCTLNYSLIVLNYDNYYQMGFSFQSPPVKAEQLETWKMPICFTGSLRKMWRGRFYNNFIVSYCLIIKIIVNCDNYYYIKKVFSTFNLRKPANKTHLSVKYEIRASRDLYEKCGAKDFLIIAGKIIVQLF